MSRPEELQQLSIAWNDAWNSRDLDLLADLMAGDGTYYEPELSEPTPGRPGLRAAAEKTWAEWPSATFQLVTLTIQGDRAIVEWRSTATHRSGVQLRLEGVDVLEWDGDKVKAARVYYDVHQRKTALGGS
ncbi:MAG: nuclear transport factor 2 family protein [Deltaproteobacteria bacterium]|nr:nuclear transport factor 2 family protein [Deltaproteobacteria bacterium]